MPKILITEDDQFVANICRRKFEQEGFEVLMAAHGAAAIGILKREKFDAVVLDLMLPEIDGMAVLRFIRSQGALRGLPVIILSNSAYFSGLAESAWAAGATNFLNKGENGPDELVKEVRKLLVPAAPKPQQRTCDEPPPLPARAYMKRATGSIRVIVADDDKVVHGVLGFFMEQANFVVRWAFDGQRALEMAEAEPPDIMVLDGMMPKLDGFELLKLWQLNPKLAKIPVIMLTAKDEESVKEDTLGVGAVEYLTKPFNPGAVVDLIRQYVGPRV
jgi:two-component system, sensor histidine kinase and response regulator